jgi:hypothetical protein
VKTKSDLVVMPSEERIFAFFCSERDHKPQNSGCGYTTQSFHTAWVKMSRATHFVGTAGLPQKADLPGQKADSHAEIAVENDQRLPDKVSRIC